MTGNTGRERIKNKKSNFQSAGEQYYWNNRFTINFSQPVFHWDHWVQLSQSNNRIAQAEAEYQAKLQNLIVKTTEAYFNILSAQDNLGFTMTEQKAIGRQLDQAKQRFDVDLMQSPMFMKLRLGLTRQKLIRLMQIIKLQMSLVNLVSMVIRKALGCK